MQNLEWYLADLKSTGKNTIETVEKSLTDMFIRLVRIYSCLSTLTRSVGTTNLTLCHTIPTSPLCIMTQYYRSHSIVITPMASFPLFRLVHPSPTIG